MLVENGWEKIWTCVGPPFLFVSLFSQVVVCSAKGGTPLDPRLFLSFYFCLFVSFFLFGPLFLRLCTMGERKVDFEFTQRVETMEDKRINLVPAANCLRFNNKSRRYSFRTKPCYFYAKGMCRYGSKCRFIHDTSACSWNLIKTEMEQKFEKFQNKIIEQTMMNLKSIFQEHVKLFLQGSNPNNTSVS